MITTMKSLDSDTSGSADLREPLRIGILLDSFVLPAWAHCMLERIARERYAKIVLIIANASPRSSETLLATRGSRRATMFYRLYRRWDKRLFRGSPDAFAEKDASSLLANIPVLRVVPVQTKYSDQLGADDVSKIRAFHLDVLIRLGFRILRGDVLNAAKFGVWSLHHADNQVNRGGPPSFWEVFRNEPVTGSILQKLTEDLNNGAVLYRSFSATDAFSVERNNHSLYWKAQAFVPRALRHLREQGAEEFRGQVERLNDKPRLYSRPLRRVPTNQQFLRLLSPHLLKKMRKKVNDFLYHSQWFLLYDFSKAGFDGSLWRYKAMVPPPDRLWADPHVVFRDGKYYIYLEEMLFSKPRGFISVIVMDPDGTHEKPTPVLERDYHLSYPFVFEWRNELYMVPESCQNRTIELYKCSRFPDRWELHHNVMAGVAAVDSTLFHHNGKWWLFANMAETPGVNICDELYLFHSDDPVDGRWTPHPKNPIVSDVRRSRPAGRICERNGRLYRPSQDSALSGGFGIRINEITTINENDYEEVEVCLVEPKWKDGLLGVHTFSNAHELTVVDALQRRSIYGMR